MTTSSAWHGWIGSQIEQLRAQDLLRTLKPLIPGHSAVEVNQKSDANAVYFAGVCVCGSISKADLCMNVGACHP